MPQVRNEGTNPIAVDDVVINPGATVTIPDEDWKTFIANKTAKRTLGPFLTVVAGKGKSESKPEPEGGGEDAQTLEDAITDMLEADPGKANNDWWTAKGEPDARELGSRIGRTVKSTERNKAWADYNADPDADGE